LSLNILTNDFPKFWNHSNRRTKKKAALAFISISKTWEELGIQRFYFALHSYPDLFPNVFVSVQRRRDVGKRWDEAVALCQAFKTGEAQVTLLSSRTQTYLERFLIL
jgi:hypothetical protein